MQEELQGIEVPVLVLEDSHKWQPKPLDSGVVPANLVYMFYTSGTSGKPKGLSLSTATYDTNDNRQRQQ